MKQALRKYLSSGYEYKDSLLNYGLLGLLNELKVRRMIWTLESANKSKESQSKFATSITDRPSYLDICKLAVSDDQVFKIFKRCREYRLVLEHVSRYQGEQYLNIIHEKPEILENMIKVAALELGNPIRYSYDKIGLISPTQIRYAKILSDLENYFKLSNVKRIIEVGVGNGGQAAQVCSYIPTSLEKYILVDLPEVLGLTEKTLVPYSFTSTFTYMPPSEIKIEDSDLFISNYAFSELKKPIQQLYYDNFIKNSKSGYMLYNHIHEKDDESFSVFEMSEMIPNSKVIPETPNTFKNNYLLLWGTK